MTELLLSYITKELMDEESQEEFHENSDLLGSGIIDSLGMMRLIVFLETEFDVKIPPEEMLIENFMTVSHIQAYIKNKKNVQ